MAGQSSGLSMYEQTLLAIRQLNERLGFDVDDRVEESAALACHVISLPKKRTLFHIGETPHYFYRVLKGCVQLHITPPDSEEKKILALLRDGESLCHEAALLGEAYPVSAESVSDTQVLACPRQYIHTLVKNQPEVAYNMLQNLCKQNLALTRRMGDLLLKSGAARVACYLLAHAPRLNTKAFEVTLPASKHSVASHLHISSETFSRILADMKKARVIEVHGRVISVLDSEALGKLRAGFSMNGLQSGAEASSEDACTILGGL